VPEVVSAAAFGYVGRMRGLVAVAAVGAAFYGAGVAHAGTVTLANGVMAFEAGAGEANRVFVIRDDDGMHLVDTAVPVTAGGGCTPENATEVFCASEDLTLLEIDVVAGDENDYIDLRPAGAFLASKLDGGDGNDKLLGGFAFSGNVFDGGVGADMFGGDWGGTVDYSERTNPVTVTIGDELPNDGEAGEGDFVSAGIDQVYGGHAADTITAMNVQGVNRTYLRGGEGNDHLSALQVDWTMHTLMIESMDNQILLTAHQQNFDKIRMIRLHGRSPRYIPLALEEHLVVIKALKQRDADRAAAGLEHHLKCAERRALGL